MEITIEDIKKLIGEIAADLFYENMILKKEIINLKAQLEQAQAAAKPKTRARKKVASE